MTTDPRLFAIADLHLQGGGDKPMDVFGAHWTGHFAHICEDWRLRVRPCDLVLVPGDISWAMTLEEALPDIRDIGALPGRKLLLRGNHDYWWSSLSRLRAALPEGMHALQNDAFAFSGCVIAGARGWICESADEQDRKIYLREAQRLELSLKEARRIAPHGRLIAMMHYPPVNERGEDTLFTALLEAYGATDCVYGHLHGAALRGAFSGRRGPVRYRCVSCDCLGFALCAIT